MVGGPVASVPTSDVGACPTTLTVPTGAPTVPDSDGLEPTTLTVPTGGAIEKEPPKPTIATIPVAGVVLASSDGDAPPIAAVPTGAVWVSVGVGTSPVTVTTP